MKGIRSPWAKPPAAPEDPLEGARPGRQPVQIQGRTYTFVVNLPLRLPEDKAKGLALNALGEALGELQAEHPELQTELATQRLSLDERPLGACVSLPLGSRILHALASSTNEALALAMAVDRLALALTRLMADKPGARAILDAHYINLLRTT